MVMVNIITTIMIAMIPMTIMLIWELHLRTTRCQYWVERPMSKQAKEKVRVPPASISVLGDDGDDGDDGVDHGDEHHDDDDDGPGVDHDDDDIP